MYDWLSVFSRRVLKILIKIALSPLLSHMKKASNSNLNPLFSAGSGYIRAIKS